MRPMPRNSLALTTNQGRLRSHKISTKGVGSREGKATYINSNIVAW